MVTPEITQPSQELLMHDLEIKIKGIIDYPPSDGSSPLYHIIRAELGSGVQNIKYQDESIKSQIKDQVEFFLKQVSNNHQTQPIWLDGKGWGWDFENNIFKGDSGDLEKGYAYCLGIGVHEGGHILATKIEKYKDLIDIPGFFEALNWCEDLRVEATGIGILPGAFEWIKEALRRNSAPGGGFDYDKARQKAEAELGHVPLQTQLGCEIRKFIFEQSYLGRLQSQPEIDEYISHVPTQKIREALAKLTHVEIDGRSILKRFYTEIPRDQSDAETDRSATASAKVMIEEIWPIFKEIYQEAIDDHALYKLLSDLLKKAGQLKGQPQIILVDQNGQGLSIDQLPPSLQEAIKKALDQKSPPQTSADQPSGGMPMPSTGGSPGGQGQPSPGGEPGSEPGGQGQPTPDGEPGSDSGAQDQPTPGGEPGSEPGGQGQPTPDGEPGSEPGGQGQPTPDGEPGSDSGAQDQPTPCGEPGSDSGGQGQPAPGSDKGDQPQTAPWDEFDETTKDQLKDELSKMKDQLAPESKQQTQSSAQQEMDQASQKTAQELTKPGQNGKASQNPSENKGPDQPPDKPNADSNSPQSSGQNAGGGGEGITDAGLPSDNIQSSSNETNTKPSSKPPMTDMDSNIPKPEKTQKKENKHPKEKDVKSIAEAIPKPEQSSYYAKAITQFARVRRVMNKFGNVKRHLFAPENEPDYEESTSGEPTLEGDIKAKRDPSFMKRFRKHFEATSSTYRITLLLDQSGSEGDEISLIDGGNSTLIAEQYLLAVAIVETFKNVPGLEIGVMGFSSSFANNVVIYKKYTEKVNHVVRSRMGGLLNYGGSTPMLESIQTTVNYAEYQNKLRPVDHNLLLPITDGIPDDPDNFIADLTRFLHRKHTLVMPFGISQTPSDSSVFPDLPAPVKKAILKKLKKPILSTKALAKQRLNSSSNMEELADKIIITLSRMMLTPEDFDKIYKQQIKNN